MQVIKAGYEIMNPFSEYMTNEQYFNCMAKHIERIGRTCYKSEDSISEESYKRFVTSLVDRGHEAMIEHCTITVKFIVDRGVSHEIVRHRIASFAQESTRYCNYSKEKFGKEITVIEPFYLMPDGENVSTDNWSERYGAWVSACEEAERSYFRMLNDGATPQEARAVLPTSLKTEIIVTMNLREWRHFFKLRALDVTGKAHPQMKEVAVPLMYEFARYMPEVFKF